MTDDAMDLPGFESIAGVDLAQKLPLFRTLSFDEVRQLFAIAHTEERAAGDVIIDEDALGSALYIVREGTTRISRRGVELGTRGPGEILGEMSLVDDVLTSARVIAATPVSLIVLPRPAFDALMNQQHTLALKVYKAFCRTLSERLRRANEHLPSEDLLDTGVC
jgi:CRP/FNR family cyclic AMP-dependent transcriptional regulator